MLFIIVTAFLTGAGALLYQVIFLREFLTIYYGNELCIGSVLALWLLGTALGGAAGAKISVFFNRNREKALFILFFLVHLLFPVFLFFLRGSIDLFIKTKGEYLPVYNLFFQCVFFMFPLNFIIGFMFPLFCSCARQNNRNRLAVAMVYLSQSAGALVAGIVFTFFLIGRWDYFQTALIQISLAAVIIIFRFNKQKIVVKILFIFCVLSAGVWLFNRMPFLEKYSADKKWEAFFSPLNLSESIDTRYQNAAVGKHEGQLDVYANLKYQFSLPDPYSNEIYAQIILCQSVNPKNILLIGGAYSGIAQSCLTHRPEQIDIVELDENYVGLIQKNLSYDSKEIFDSQKVSLYFTDARFFIKKRQIRYDVVFINIPDPDTAMLNRFYTEDFFRELKHVITDNGICAFKARSVPNYMGDEIARYNKIIYWTLKNNFEDVIVVPGEDKIFIACKNKNILSTSPTTLIDRFHDRVEENPVFSPEIFYPIFEPDRMNFLEKKLSENLSATRTNTDSNPIAYYINLYIWDTFSGSKLRPVLLFIEKIRPIHVVLALFVFISALLLPQYIKPFARRDKNYLKIILYWIIFSTGFTGMGIELFLLFMFQNIFGYLYSMIGFIVALFMFGLVAGSLSAMVCVKKSESVSFIVKILILSEISIPVLSFSLPFFMKTLTGSHNTSLIHFVFTVLVALCGFLTGLEFPLAAHLFNKLNKDICFSSGILSNADHLGAFFRFFSCWYFFLYQF